MNSVKKFRIVRQWNWVSEKTYYIVQRRMFCFLWITDTDDSGNRYRFDSVDSARTHVQEQKLESGERTSKVMEYL